MSMSNNDFWAYCADNDIINAEGVLEGEDKVDPTPTLSPVSNKRHSSRPPVSEHETISRLSRSRSRGPSLGDIDPAVSRPPRGLGERKTAGHEGDEKTISRTQAHDKVSLVAEPRKSAEVEVKSSASSDTFLKGLKPGQVKSLLRIPKYKRPDVSLRGQVFQRQTVNPDADPVSQLMAKHQFQQPDLTMAELDQMKRTGLTPKRLWFTEIYSRYTRKTTDSLDSIMIGQPVKIVNGKTEVERLSYDKLLATTLIDKGKWPGFAVPNLSKNLRSIQEDSLLAVSATRNVSETVLGILCRILGEFVIASQETRRLTSVLPHFLEFVPLEHKDMFEGIQYDLLRISKACAESTERLVLLQEACQQTDTQAVIIRLKDLRTKWRQRMKEYPLVDILDERDDSSCRFRTNMAPGPTHVAAKKFVGLVKVCRPSIQSAWKWGPKSASTPTTSGSASKKDTPAVKATKKPGGTCSRCNSRKHTVENCPQISSVAKKLNAARGGGKSKRGRGRGRKRKFGDSL